MTKRVLFLGGSYFQIPAIKYAKGQGYYVITCDYLPDNPGHKFSDEYYNVSTTDKAAVLELARKLHLDGIVAYASDPAAQTAAYVGNKIALPSNPYETIEILTNKDKYRSFLFENGFNAPKTKGFSDLKTAEAEIDSLRMPVLVKPVDSSGSKGVSKINSRVHLPKAFVYAKEFSRCKRIIVEEIINQKGSQIGGDAFVDNGKLVFCCLGDQLSGLRHNPFVPFGMVFPTSINLQKQLQITQILQKILSRLNFMHGALNLEIMFDQNDSMFFMEIGPRTGGNFIPETIRYCTGGDLIMNTVEIALGNPSYFENPGTRSNGSLFAYYVIYSEKEGRLDNIAIEPSLYANILEKHIFKKQGDHVPTFHGSNCTVGILLLKFKDRQEMQHNIEHMSDYLKVNLF